MKIETFDNVMIGIGWIAAGFATVDMIKSVGKLFSVRKETKLKKKELELIKEAVREKEFNDIIEENEKLLHDISRNLDLRNARAQKIYEENLKLMRSFNEMFYEAQE